MMQTSMILNPLHRLPPHFDAIRSKSLKLFGPIKRSSASHTNVVLYVMPPGKMKQRENSKFGGITIIWPTTNMNKILNKLIRDRNKLRKMPC